MEARIPTNALTWAGLVLCAAGAWGADRPAARGADLRVLTGGWPRAFFFRGAEGWAANPRVGYAQWDETFGRLMGIEGKVLDEEVPGRSVRNVDFFTRFKRAHGGQLVLLHYNGNARDPRWQRGEFFAGHWVYRAAAAILADVPAEEGVSVIRVDKANLFRVDTGRYRASNDDVGLCERGRDGRLDWHKSEQVQLVGVDAKRGVIRVRRGCYGTRPRAFRAKQAFAAAHATEGPWGRRSHLMWYYNHSTRCPRDAGGRTCGQVHAEELARRFLPGGELAAFDGVEFDVLAHRRGGGLDCDADGNVDNGIFDGVNTYGIGVVEFIRELRQRLPDKLILADGHGPDHQRAFGLLNGIESEGWPALRDVAIRDWSGGLNRHFFWAANARKPVLNYVNHKFNEPSGQPGVVRRPDTPWSTHRLVFAAAVFTDAAICYSFAPPKEPDELLGVWDELWMGSEKRVGWLGEPLGPAVRLAQRQRDLLEGAGSPPGEKLLGRLAGEGVRFSARGGGVRAAAADTRARELRFRLRDVPCSGPDLFVSVEAHAERMAGYPPETARLAHVGIAAATDQSYRGEAAAGEPGGRGALTPARRFMTWANAEAFTSGFYFDDVRGDRVDLELVIEGGEPIRITGITAHAHPDAMYREFANGLVLANPSPRPFELDLAKLLPGRRYRRIKAQPLQDGATNNGQPVGAKLRLGPKDALFLVREKGGT